MSAIAGIYFFDDRPIIKSELIGIIDHPILSKRGPDDRGIWVNGSIGLAQRAFWTTPEQKLEVQPLVYKNGEFVLVLDGRVDNRKELISSLREAGVTDPLITDSDLVLYSYILWKENCPGKIVGDFAFAIWDNNKKELFCTRDVLGIRPFYYYKSERFFIFASDALALFEFPEILKKPNLNAMSAYLVNNFEDPRETEFKDVFRLVPAHSITVSKQYFKAKRYWDIDPNKILKLNKIEDYIDVFLETFTTSIKNHLRSITPIGITLSGGLDSSSVFCLIEDLKLKSKLEVDICAYSQLFESQEANESSYIKSIQEKWKTQVKFLHSSEPPYPLWEVPEAINTTLPLWSIEGIMLTKKLYNHISNDGKRVVLGGEGGDEFLDTSIFLATDLLLKGHIFKAFKFIKNFSEYYTTTYKFATQVVLNKPFEGLRRKTPKWLKQIYKSVHPNKTLNWICQPYRDNLFEKFRKIPWYLTKHKFKNFSHQETYASIHNGYLFSGYELLDRLGTSSGPVEVRHPFADRRLIELVSSIPDEIMVHGLRPKGFLRTAMQDKLPTTIANRMNKGDLTPLINRLLIHTNKEAINELFKNMYLDEIGLIDKKKVKVIYETYCNDYANNLSDSTGSDITWQILSLEYWARNTFDKIMYKREVKEEIKNGKQTIKV